MPPSQVRRPFYFFFAFSYPLVRFAVLKKFHTHFLALPDIGSLQCSLARVPMIPILAKTKADRGGGGSPGPVLIYFLPLIGPVYCCYFVFFFWFINFLTDSSLPFSSVFASIHKQPTNQTKTPFPRPNTNPSLKQLELNYVKTDSFLLRTNLSESTTEKTHVSSSTPLKSLSSRMVLSFK